MKTLVVDGHVTASSKREDSKYKQEVPTITCYIKAADEKAEKELEDFGMRKYTSKEDGESFFIVKASRETKFYVGTDVEKLDTSIEHGKQYKTSDAHPVRLAILYVEPDSGNAFYRLYAVAVESMDQVEYIEPKNPFLTEGLEEETPF